MIRISEYFKNFEEKIKIININEVNLNYFFASVYTQTCKNTSENKTDHSSYIFIVTEYVRRYDLDNPYSYDSNMVSVEFLMKNKINEIIDPIVSSKKFVIKKSYKYPEIANHCYLCVLWVMMKYDSRIRQECNDFLKKIDNKYNLLLNDLDYYIVYIYHYREMVKLADEKTISYVLRDCLIHANKLNKIYNNSKIKTKDSIVKSVSLGPYMPKSVSLDFCVPKSETKNNKKITKKYKKKTIPKKIREMVWDKYIGLEKGTAKCMCCKTTIIKQMQFHCGHVVSEKCGGTMNIDNLRPICATCNLSMGTKNMNEFIKEHGL